MPLCETCRGIPSVFFGPGSSFVHRHLPLNEMRRSAAAGCGLCEFLVRNVDADWLPPGVQASVPCTLQRGILAPETEFQLCVGADDISLSWFYRKPVFWRQHSSLLARASFNSEQTALMTGWLRDCQRNHPGCRKGPIYFLPTRLLDLRRFANSADVVLTTPSDGLGYPRYCALSHCWGPIGHRPIVTNSHNIGERQSRIPFNDLPLSFQDAVGITRELSIRYLWIDSLCIIQDSRADWEEEAARMGRVYASATCTLAAACSEDSTGGCRVTDNEAVPRGKSIDVVLGNDEFRIFSEWPLDWNEEYEPCILRTRAWTAQERELSTRNVHFSHSLLLWECKSGKASSELPWYQVRFEDPPKGLLLNTVWEQRGDKSFLQRRENWFNLVEDYSRKSLTYEEDRLSAFSGLAHRELGASRGRYCAGLFEHDMPSALLWRAKHAPESSETHAPAMTRRPAKYRAPSWSWSSLEGEVTFASQRIFSPRDIDRSGATTNDCDFRDFAIESISISPAGRDPLGSVSEGHLRVRGRLLSGFLDLETQVKYRMTQDKNSVLLLAGERRVPCIAQIDVLNEIHHRQQVQCLSIRNESEDCTEQPHNDIISIAGHNDWVRTDQDKFMGLVMLFQGPSSDCFRRIGIVRGLAQSDDKEARVQQVVIV